MQTAAGTLSQQLRPAFLSQSAWKAAYCIFPLLVFFFPCCSRAWIQEFNMKLRFLCFWTCACFRLQLSSVCLPCGHMSTCIPEVYLLFLTPTLGQRRPVVWFFSMECLHLCVPLLHCVLHCLVWFEGLDRTQVSGAGRPPAVTDNSFFTHTRKQTVHTHTQAWRYTHPQTDGSHTPTYWISIHMHMHPSLCPRQYVKQSQLTCTVSLHSKEFIVTGKGF